MRIISQNGMIDIPYENAALSIESIENGYAVYEYLSYNACLLAKYDCKEKAKRVLEILHRLYSHEIVQNWSCPHNYQKVFQFPANEDVNVE